VTAGRDPGPDPDPARAILEERARRLARPAAVESRRADLVELLFFELAGESCAIEAPAVRQVARLGEVTPVPGAPPALLGVTNLGGEILPVFDLRRITGASPSDGALARLIVLGDGRDDLAIAAGAVHEVRTLDRAAIVEAPPSLPAAARAVVLGVTGEATVVLDAARLLGDPRLRLDGASGVPSLSHEELS